MRFCLVTTFYPPYNFGGDGVYVRGLARELVKRGHEVEVVHCADAYRLKRREPETPPDDPGIRLHRLKNRYGMLSPLLTQQTGKPVLKKNELSAVLDQGFDVIHFHNITLVGGPGVLEMGQADLRLYTPHDYWPLCTAHVFWKHRKRPCDGPQCWRCALRSGIPPQLWRGTGLMQRGFESVHRILAPSRHCARRYELAALGPVVNVLPLFADMQPTAAVNSDPGDYFLYAGRLERLKGVDYLLEVFRELDAPLWLAGEGPLTRAASRQDGVRVLGHVGREELAALMSNARAVVAPSRVPETFGLSVVEGFACGTPAIVSDRGGLPELAQANEAGFVCRDAEEFRTAVRRLQDDSALRDTLGQRARQSFEQDFTADLHLRRYLELIADALGQRAA